jgi:integrase
MLSDSGAGPYSAHSWRKAWGRHALDKGIPMAVIQTKLGHRTPASPLDYLGITREDVR